MENSVSPTAKAKNTVTLTVDQQKLVDRIGENVNTVMQFGANVEEDLKDGLTKAEIVEALFDAPRFASAVSGLVKDGRLIRKEPKETREAILLAVGEIVGAEFDPDGVSKVELTFDFVADIAVIAAKGLNVTKKYIQAVKA